MTQEATIITKSLHYRFTSKEEKQHVRADVTIKKIVKGGCGKREEYDSTVSSSTRLKR
jgi:hypothetical protein